MENANETTPLRSQENNPGGITDFLCGFFFACCAQICQGIQDAEEAEARQEYTTARIENDQGHSMHSIEHLQTGRAKEYDAMTTQAVTKSIKATKPKTQCGHSGHVTGESVGGVICCFLLCCKSTLDVIQGCKQCEESDYDATDETFTSGGY